MLSALFFWIIDDLACIANLTNQSVIKKSYTVRRLSRKCKYGEELCVCIILRPGMQAEVEEIRSFCSGQIAHYKVPRYVRFVDAFPMTVTGKIQKFILRQQVAGDLGLAMQS